VSSKLWVAVVPVHDAVVPGDVVGQPSPPLSSPSEKVIVRVKALPSVTLPAACAMATVGVGGATLTARLATLA
jgi:hypothetical protein